MRRLSRMVVPGFPHHVTQRGDHQADIFQEDADYEVCLGFLKHYADNLGLSIWAHCLMMNHVHPVALPQREESLGQTMRDMHTVYAMYFNSRTQVSGHVWQGRFFSCPLDESHLWAELQYVERKRCARGHGRARGGLPVVKCGGELWIAQTRGVVA